MGGFVTISIIPKLSNIIVDVDKDWKGHVIKNLGDPIDAKDSARLCDVYIVGDYALIWSLIMG
ncbi:MAG: hypothetical protein QXT64_00795 [Desulfurococcaceae archaeon]